MKETKELMQTEHGQMSKAFQTFRDAFAGNWEQMVEQLKVLDTVNTNKFQELVP